MSRRYSNYYYQTPESCKSVIEANLSSMKAAGELLYPDNLTCQANIDKLFSTRMGNEWQAAGSGWRYVGTGAAVMSEYPEGFRSLCIEREGLSGLPEAARNTMLQGVTTRQVYSNPSGAGPFAGGGTGGPAALEPELVAGPAWDPISTTIRSFDITKAMIAGFLPGRRPGKNGSIKHHPDRKSTIRIMSSDGTVIYATTNFMLEGYNDSQQEGFQSMDTFDGAIGQLSDEMPRTITFRGKLLDCKSFDWVRQWEAAYDKYMKGSINAKNMWRFYILYQAEIVGGYMLNCAKAADAASEPAVPFQFSVLVTDKMPLPEMETVTDALGQLYSRYNGSTENLAADIAKLNLDAPTPEYSEIPVPDGYTGESVNPDEQQ